MEPPNSNSKCSIFRTIRATSFIKVFKAKDAWTLRNAEIVHHVATACAAVASPDVNVIITTGTCG